MPDTQQNSIAHLVSQARERLDEDLRAHAEELQKLEQSIQEFRKRHQQLEATLREQLGALAKFEPPASSSQASGASLEKVLASVRNLITSTVPDQVLSVLTEEAEQMGVRAAVFDVRGKAAWGASARGFGQNLSEKAFRAVVVPLNQDNPFRLTYETGGHVDATAELLKKNRNVLDKFKPAHDEPILLMPIRSAGSVSAIFYADPGGKGKGLPVDALKILTEFAGAQLDRLMALSGGITPAAAGAEVAEAEPVAAEESQAELIESQPLEHAASMASSASAAASTSATFEAPPPAAQPAAAGFDIAQLNEADQKVHKDAKRFAKLLISEIELYNKAKVADGRKSKDIYKRLKSDIDRSRQTYEKRFGKTVTKQFDYFHEELVRVLAGNDASQLGSEYPGPSA